MRGGSTTSVSCTLEKYTNLASEIREATSGQGQSITAEGRAKAEKQGKCRKERSLGRTV